MCFRGKKLYHSILSVTLSVSYSIFNTIISSRFDVSYQVIDMAAAYIMAKVLNNYVSVVGHGRYGSLIGIGKVPYKRLPFTRVD